MTHLWFNLTEKQQAQMIALLLRLILRQIKLTQEVNQCDVNHTPKNSS
jgi:hypothetical protein